MSSRLDSGTVVFIDAIRGLAALGVLVAHCFDFGIRGVFGDAMEGSPERWRWAVATIGHGNFFVWIFFVLSGLCIHQSITRSLERRTFSLRGYLAARVTRIYPLFMIGLGLAIAVWFFSGDPAENSAPKPWPQFLASLVSLQIFTSTFPNYMPSWSISNEMIYYVAWPVGLLLLRRNAVRTIALSATAAAAVCALIATSWFLLHRFGESTAVHGLWTVSVLFPVWLAGALLAVRWDQATRRVTRPVWFLSIALCLAAQLALARVKYHASPEPLMDAMGLLSIPGITLFIAGARHAGLGPRLHLHGLATWLGQFSYPCYTLHMPILVLINRQLIPRLGEPVASDPLLSSLVLLVPTLLLVAAVGPPLERSIMAWRSRCLASLRA